MEDQTEFLAAKGVQAIALARQGKSTDALRMLDELVEQYPENAELAYNRALVIQFVDPHYETLIAGRELAKRFPGHYYGPLLQSYANIQMRRGRAALKCLGAAEKLGAPETEANGLRARALILVGKRREAMTLVAAGSDLPSIRAKLVVTPPSDPVALEQILVELSSAGESPENIALRRSAWYSGKRRWREAADCLHPALDKTPESIDLKGQLAGVEYAMGDHTAAAKHWQEILDGSPENLRARAGMAKIEIRRGHLLTAARQVVLSIQYALRLVGDTQGQKP